MSEAAIQCGDPMVAGLIAFVAARAEEDRLGAHLTTPVDEAALDRCDVVQQVLLDMARDTCRVSEPCLLPQRCLLALGEYAFAHRTHQDFDPEWMGWRLLP
jgi:hypothetical protein